MTTALVYLGSSLFVLFALVVLFRVEDAAGGRILLSRVRMAGDRLFATGKSRSAAVAGSSRLNHLRITWYYFVHTFLRRVLDTVRRGEVRLERSLQKNKAAARELRSNGNTHFSAIAEHKERVALTDAERQERKAH